jgi:hypothetical protein
MLNLLPGCVASNPGSVSADKTCAKNSFAAVIVVFFRLLVLNQFAARTHEARASELRN